MNQHELHTWIPHLLDTAVKASEVIMEIYATDFSNEIKGDGSPVTIADMQSNAIIQEGLSKIGWPVVSEESVHAHFEERRKWPLLWIVDPLDGTKEFIKQNDEFVVCMALVHHNKPVFGMITSPVQEKILIGGVWYEPRIIAFNEIDRHDEVARLKPKTSLNNPIQMAGSRSHLSGTELKFTNELKAKYGEVNFLKKGSALKFFDLAQGLADVYPRFAPTMEWDIAAGQAILEALGGDVIHAETAEALSYNKGNLYNPYFIARTAAFKENEL